MAEKDYRHDRDAQTLRDTLRAVKVAKGISTETLLNEFRPTGAQGISRPALDKFISGENSKQTKVLGALWDYLQINYPKHFPPEAPATAQTVDITTSLNAALLGFFSGGGSLSGLKMDVPQDGSSKYVMYRPDMRPVIEPVKSNGFVRASVVEISRKGEAVTITEIQNFSAGPLGPRHRQTDEGVMFPYGHLLLFVMRGGGRVSFKVGVVETMQSYGDQSVEWFRGRLFVASDLGIFPVVRFFCLRDDGQLEKGYLRPEDIENSEVMPYLTRPI